MAQFLGKYRGTVVNNVDPMQMGRLQAIVPDVTSLLPTSWALPCVPMAGPQAGQFVVPPVGAAVWMEFEQGDPDYPIWTGCFWGMAACNRLQTPNEPRSNGVKSGNNAR